MPVHQMDFESWSRSVLMNPRAFGKKKNQNSMIVTPIKLSFFTSRKKSIQEDPERMRNRSQWTKEEKIVYIRNMPDKEFKEFMNLLPDINAD